MLKLKQFFIFDRMSSTSKELDILFLKLKNCFGKLTSNERIVFNTEIPNKSISQIKEASSDFILSSLRFSDYKGDDIIDGLKKYWHDLPNLNQNGILCPKKEHIQSFNRIHLSVANYLQSYGLESILDYGHIPLYLRINTGTYKNIEQNNRPYATTKWHLDSWAGEPADVVVFFIPLFGNFEDLGIEFREINPELEESSLRPLKSYSDGELYVKKSSLIPVKILKDNLLCWGSRTLHRTLRNKEDIRVGLDFRFRLSSSSNVKEISNEVLEKGRAENYVRYKEWLEIGRSKKIIINQTMEEAKNLYKNNSLKEIKKSKFESAVKYELISDN